MNNKVCVKCKTKNNSNANYCNECGCAIITEETFNTVAEKKPKNNYIPVLLIVAAIVLMATIQYVTREDFSFDKQMIEAASKINETCPIMIDSDTRLDNTIAVNKKFKYFCTLVNIEKSELDVPKFKSLMEPKITNNITTNPDMQYFRNEGVTTVFYYNDKNGVFIMSVSVPPNIEE